MLCFPDVVHIQIITAGTEELLRHWTIGGDVMTTVPSSHTHAFSLAYNAPSQQYEVCMCVHMCVRACVCMCARCVYVCVCTYV